MMKKGFFSLLLLANMAFASPSELVFLGDSVTDSGNIPGAPITNQNGNVWARVLGQFYGLDIQASSKGGTNYANAGAVTSGNIPVPSVNDQADRLINNSGGSLNSNALYFLLAGFNDISRFLVGAPGGNNGIDAASNMVNTTKKLLASGGQYIVVSNLPNVYIPLYNALPPGAGAAAISQINFFNTTMLRNLNGLMEDIIQINFNGLTNALFANPVRYGFDADATTNVCADNASPCSGKIFISDGLHFTTQSHAALAEYYYSVLTAPYFYSTMTNVAVSVANNQLRLINQKLINLEKGGQGLNLFLIGSLMPSLEPAQYNNRQYDANNSTSVIFGLTKNVTDNVLFGGAFSHNTGKTNLGQSMGHYDSDANILNLFVNFDDSQWFFSLLANYAWLDFDSIQRHLQFGAMSDYATGGTTGHQYGLAANASYVVFKNDKIKTGPVAELYYQHATINGYNERGMEGYANMHYNDRKYNQTNGGLGWQLLLDCELQDTPITTNFFALANKQWAPGNSRVGFNLISLPGSHGALNIHNLTPAYATLGFNSNAKLSHDVDISLGYYAQPGQDNINQQAATLAISKKLT